ncbi:MAG: hypothetical protein LBS01_06820 [Prevotellaceae bacterium]|jgi:hypothetical protein|nr:hypothetical protein [Prevotellaceae bacterium]
MNTIRKYTIILFSIFAVAASAQKIGINTETPAAGTTLHIDGQGNTVNGQNVADDVVVTSSGQLGIGTTTPAPNVMLEVNGTFKLTGGGEEARILMSDPHGNASWQYFALGDFATLFQINGTMPMNMEAGKEFIAQGTVKMVPNQLNIRTDGKSSITVPPGRYLISMESNIDNFHEYGIAKIWNKTEGVQLFHTVYQLYQSGSAVYIDLDKESELDARFTPIDARSRGLDYIAPLPYTDPDDPSRPLPFFVRFNIVRIQGNFDEVED